MKCKKCGTTLYDGDKFCPQCGLKVVKVSRCPECGAALRKGTRFCPECGRLVGGEDDDGTKVFVKDADTSDIPIDDMEQNILLETQQEMKKRPVKSSAKTAKASDERERTPASGKKSVPAPPPKKKAAPPPKKRIYEEWDEDEEEDEEEDGEHDIMTIVSVVMIFLILAAAAFLIFTMVRRQAGEDNGEQTQQTEQTQQPDEEQEEGGEPEIVQPEEPEGDGTDTEPSDQEVQPAGTLTISSNVNVRDYPSTNGTNVIKVAKAGEVYEYLGVAEDDNWYMILLEDGSTGYVFKEYVSIP